jgi:cytidyltransferase-like protein
VTRVYADMVADLFHAGHVAFLRQARSLGDELVVGIHSDDDVASYKRPPICSMQERIAVVEACSLVDEVLPNAPLSVDEAWIDLHRLDVVVHGNDFDPAKLSRFYPGAVRRGIARTVPYTPGISTSDILSRIAARGA